MKKLFDRLFLLDGGTGTALIEAGMPSGVCTEKWILENEEIFGVIQQKFVDAGANAVLAPTFGANRSRLAEFNLADKTVEYNKRLIALSKKIAGDKILVGADISPTGLMTVPYSETNFDEILDIYREQIFAAKEAGADFIFGETLSWLSDARAIGIIGNEAQLPTLLSITVDETEHTMSGMEFMQFLTIIQELGVSGVGLNCSTGPRVMARILNKTAMYAKVPIIAKPNAGMPGNIIPPKSFAISCRNLIQKGANIVGGCCGSTHEHINELSKIMTKMTITNRQPLDFISVGTERETFSFSKHEINEKSLRLFECVELYDLLDIDYHKFDLAKVKLSTDKDISTLCEIFSMTKIAILISTKDPIVLENALKNVCGRVFVESSCDFCKIQMGVICKKYGATIY